MVKKGDTLIEVMLAVGIFSMIAISIAAVMSNGTSGAQTALESTIAREEIDTQAEALRFIQSAYIADKNSNNQRFVKLWKKITENANNLSSEYSENEEKNILLNYAPNDCKQLYDINKDSGLSIIQQQKAFIINPRMLNSFKEEDVNKVYVEAKADIDNTNAAIFSSASTYPRLIFGIDQGQLVEDPSYSTANNTLSRAEGIYVIAVKDDKTTNIVGEDSKTSAFYDFYIRTCWYGSGSDEPSTISTLIRLYDPDALPSLPSDSEPTLNENL